VQASDDLAESRAMGGALQFYQGFRDRAVAPALAG
jgi:hypothetical protein